jgi:hypothetical protein
MTATEDRPIVPRALVERVRNILIKPASEWAVIDAEPATVQGLYRNYVCILAAVGPVAMFIGLVVFGYPGPFGGVRLPVLTALIQAVFNYAGWLLMVAVLALVIEAVAPRFGGERNRLQAFKVAAYSLTASLLAGVFAILPSLSMLAILGLYSLYLLYVGLPKLMRVPEDKALGFFVVVVAASIGLAILAGLLLSIPARMFGYAV